MQGRTRVRNLLEAFVRSLALANGDSIGLVVRRWRTSCRSPIFEPHHSSSLNKPPFENCDDVQIVEFGPADRVYCSAAELLDYQRHGVRMPGDKDLLALVIAFYLRYKCINVQRTVGRVLIYRSS